MTSATAEDDSSTKPEDLGHLESLRCQLLKTGRKQRVGPQTDHRPKTNATIEAEVISAAAGTTSEEVWSFHFIKHTKRERKKRENAPCRSETVKSLDRFSPCFASKFLPKNWKYNDVLSTDMWEWVETLRFYIWRNDSTSCSPSLILKWGKCSLRWAAYQINVITAAVLLIWWNRRLNAKAMCEKLSAP